MCGKGRLCLTDTHGSVGKPPCIKGHWNQGSFVLTGHLKPGLCQVWFEWCGMVLSGVVLCGVVWYGVEWCGVVWCGVVWC